jgi:hypothetical protein
LKGKRHCQINGLNPGLNLLSCDLQQLEPKQRWRIAWDHLLNALNIADTLLHVLYVALIVKAVQRMSIAGLTSTQGTASIGIAGKGLNTSFLHCPFPYATVSYFMSGNTSFTCGFPHRQLNLHLFLGTP